MNSRRDAPGGGLRAWREAHLFGFVSAFGRIAARPWATALTVGVMAVALALPLCLMMLLDEVGRFAGSMRDSREVALFLAIDADAAQAAQLAERLGGDARIAAIEPRSPAQGLDELRGLPELSGALDLLDGNPLPYVLLLTPAAGVDEAALVGELAALADVDYVQHDARWRDRLNAWLGFGARLAAVVAALLALGALLVVGNTVRLDIGARSEEIAILRLLGASNGFVRRPFLYLGSWYGGMAGLGALVLALAARAALAAPVAALVATYEGDFTLASVPIGHAVALFSGAVALGWIGAYLAVGHHLRHAEGSE